MISLGEIKRLAIKYQTTEQSVIREYFQHLFLSYFYQQPISSSVYFKGGTALRIIYNSPRFSEDLDFSAVKINIKNLEENLLFILDQIEKENINVSLKEAKTTSGGYLANIIFETREYPKVAISLEISFRKDKLKGEVITIVSDFIPPYLINGLNQELLVEEKIEALFSRKKPRDFYDLYFILRSNLLPKDKEKILSEALKIIKKTDINFSRELKIFLPKSHWAIIRDFKEVLSREIQRLI